MRFVPIKTDDQLDLQAIHRVQDRLVSRRTAMINQIRAFLLERGLVFAKRPAQLKAAMADVLENAEADLTPMMRNLINTLWDEWKTVERQIEELGEELERISTADVGCTRIRQISGIGPVVATAIVAAIGNGAAVRKGRDLAAWLGIVPRQYSTGGKARLFSISKRGNVLPAQNADPWRPDHRAPGKTGQGTLRTIAGSIGFQSSHQRRGGGHGQQARPHCLGGSVQRQRLPISSCDSLESAGKHACGSEALHASTFPHHDDDS